MRLARTAPPLPREVWLAGVEPAISGAQNRRDGLSPTARGARARPWRRPEGRRPWNRTTLHRRIRAALAQSACRRFCRHRSELRSRGPPIVQIPEAGRRRGRVVAKTHRRHEASPGNRTLLAGLTTRGLASSRATQSRREDSNPRTPTVGAWCSPLSYGERETPSTGVEPASPGRQPGRVSRRFRGRAVTQYPERESNPRFRCERPASSTARRSGQDRCEAATAGVEPAFAG